MSPKKPDPEREEGPRGAFQGEDYLRGPDHDPMREEAAERARSVVEPDEDEERKEPAAGGS